MTRQRPRAAGMTEFQSGLRAAASQTFSFLF
jgi:hypothetical protein